MKTIEQLQQEVNILKDELLKMRFQIATGKLEHPHKIKAAKREIARLLTKINQQQHQEASDGK